MCRDKNRSHVNQRHTGKQPRSGLDRTDHPGLSPLSLPHPPHPLSAAVCRCLSPSIACPSLPAAIHLPTGSGRARRVRCQLSSLILSHPQNIDQ